MRMEADLLASANAIPVVEKTFPVTVLPTDSAMNYTPPYPSTITIHVPTEQVPLLAIYGVAERVFLAPRGWTGNGVTGSMAVHVPPCGPSLELPSQGP